MCHNMSMSWPIFEAHKKQGSRCDQGQNRRRNSLRHDGFEVPHAERTNHLANTHPDDIAAFKKELQDAFALAVVKEFGELPDGPIPSDEVLDGAVNAPGAVTLRILYDAGRSAARVVTVNEETHRNSLDLFFLKVGEHGRGLGLKAWLAIERRFPETVAWQTHTPYFEKRNIHFYVNKCGFRIIEFFNRHKP